MSYFNSLSSWQNANSAIQTQQGDLEQENKDKKASGIEEKFNAVNTKLQEGGGGLAGLGAGYQLGRKILKKARTIQQKAKEAKQGLEDAKGKVQDALGGKNEPPSEHETPPSESSNTPNGMENEPPSEGKAATEEPEGVEGTVKETELHSATEKTDADPDEGSAEDRLGATDDDFEKQIGSNDTKTNVGEQPSDAKAPELNEDGDTANPFKQGDRASGDAQDSKLENIPEEQEPSYGIGGDDDNMRVQSTEETEPTNNTSTRPNGTEEETEMPDEVEGDDNIISSLADRASSTIADVKNAVNGKINDVVNAVKSKIGNASGDASAGTDAGTDAAAAGEKVGAKVGEDALEEAGGVLDFLGPIGEIAGAGIALGSLFHTLFDKKKEDAKEAVVQNAGGIITQSTGISTASLGAANTKSNTVGGLV
tara:strand:+ start:6302 stop:7573 length:1272 start_codon:yes stop_codon:yes gene_type:complete